jgi:hypothetical protein
MEKSRIFKAFVITLIFGLCLSSTAMAGPGTVEVTVPGDISLRMGAQVRFIPTAEVDRDFGLSDGLNSAQELTAARALAPMACLGDSPKTHLTEGAGAVKDSYIRGEHRLFFNFAHEQDWDVYMMLEVDTLFQSHTADRTDFAWGRQTQQFGVERLNASFNLPAINSRLWGGWDARGVDIGYGGFLYADDDPGLGIKGAADNWMWEAVWIKKMEDEAGYADEAIFLSGVEVNPLGAPDQGQDQDRDFYYAKLGHDFGDNRVLEGFGMYHRNRVGGNDVDHYIVGLQGKCTRGRLSPMFEIAYATGEFDRTDVVEADIDAMAAFGDIAIDLSDKVGLKKFEPHIGGYWLSGDDDPADDDLEGWTEVVGITRFSPRFGTEQGISHDGNPLLGQIEYSFFPAYYGTQGWNGGGINGGADFDNPGFIMLGGGVNAAWGKFGLKSNVMAMWFESEEAVEAFYERPAIALTDVEIDDFMGVEWNNELAYKLYDQVTLKGGASFLFPGDGAEDITQALDAHARGVDFDEGEASDDVSMRFAAELIWFF